MTAPLLALTLVGCASGAAHESPSADSAHVSSASPTAPPAPVVLDLPARGVAVEVAPHRVLLYSLSGHRIVSVAASIANDSVSLNPWLVDRYGRKLILSGGKVRFGTVKGRAPAYFKPTSLRVRANGTTRVVPAPAGMAGHGSWVMGAPSPTSRWMLAQWSGECEVPTAYMVDAETGHVRAFGRLVRGQPAESIALGWQSAARAVVHFPMGACGRSAKKPGVYTVSAHGAILKLIVPTDRGVRAYMWGSF